MLTTDSTPCAYTVGDVEKLEIFKRGKIVFATRRIAFLIFEENFFVKVLEARPENSRIIDHSIMPSRNRIASMEHEISMMEKAGKDCAFQPLGRVLLDGETVGFITNLGVCMPKTLPDYYRNTEPLLGGPSFTFPTQKLVTELVPLVSRLHDAGVLHGDIKPSNILYCKQQSRFLFCDFGSACLLSSPEEVGGSTIPYETPARAQGLETPLSKEDDLYATGITLWELASSRAFFYDIDHRNEWTEDVVAVGFQPNLYEVKDVATRELVRSLLDQAFPYKSGFDDTPYSRCVHATVVYSNCIAEIPHTYPKIVHGQGCEGDNMCGDRLFQPPSPLGHIEQRPCDVCLNHGSSTSSLCPEDDTGSVTEVRA